MIIRRWQAPVVPSREQLEDVLVNESMKPIMETFPPDTKVSEHRHPFGEVLYIVSGTLIVNVSGNQLLMRPGDRIEIPSNTRHGYTVNDSQGCQFLLAFRPF